MSLKRLKTSSFLLSVLVVALLACAIPKDQGSFSVRAPNSPSGPDFLSSSELMASGLVTEALGLGAKGRLFDAEARLRRAHALTPDNQAVAFNLAIVLGQQGYAEEALEIFQRLRAEQGDLPRLMVALADVYTAQGDFTKAREVLKVAFNAYQKENNLAQAALIARSISNLAFADGYEQEALCYSYEGLSLSAVSKQLGQHGSLMVGLNLYHDAESFLTEQIARERNLGADAKVHLARSLSHGALGNLEESLKESEIALDLTSDEPETTSEINALWWLLKKQVPETEVDPKVLESNQKKIESLYPEVIALKEKPTYSMLRWPLMFRDLLNKVEEKPKEWW